jgi:hypothetical protein
MTRFLREMWRFVKGGPIFFLAPIIVLLLVLVLFVLLTDPEGVFPFVYSIF